MLKETLCLTAAVVFAMGCGDANGVSEEGAVEQGPRIQPYVDNPYYWQYDGTPVLLVGGSDDDNLFQWTGPRLTEHLDTLVRVGGNYIRNTMSARDAGNVHPWARDAEGRYDLDRWNDAYWTRFERLLEETARRGIVVQIEIWAFHDFTEEDWEASPWNPANNVNYTAAETELQTASYGDYTTVEHDFFLTVPALQDDRVVLAYQERFVDRVLAYTLAYDHVLYCITNEIFAQYAPEWGWYWAAHLREQAAAAGRHVAVTEMYQESDVRHEQHRASLDHPERYDYVDISQNSIQTGQTHWDRLQWVRAYLEEAPRPINHTKIYGGPRGTWTGGPGHGIERFWRNVIGGAASVRFHRPPSGIGLSEEAQVHLRSARLFGERFDVFRATPDAESRLLTERNPNEAYLTAVPEEQYAVYFPDGGSVGVNLTEAPGAYALHWLDIADSTWGAPETVAGGRIVQLTAPESGHWIALLTRL